MTIYTTKQDAIEREIIESLGDYGNDYDIDAIADELLEFDDATDEDGTVHLDRQGFRVRKEYDNSPEGCSAFWALVEAHEKVGE